ncbi:DUF1398 family protein [Furfurilactobacillus entadae]|uniref:DUF1398 family protein n=1 Tax=Furfurilactobacillus entadae TaxID=2922307 RepID=UPI0035EC3BC3
MNAEQDAGGFAKLMQAFSVLGVTRYDYLVAEGLYRYYDADSHVDLAMNGVPKPVAKVGNQEAIIAAVRGAQAGDFERFAELAGEAGVPVWTSDLVAKEVTYYDGDHNALHVEPIPRL